MSRIQIVTDSTAYFSREEAQRLRIRVVPLSVTFSGVTKDEGFPGEFQDFYRQLETSDDFPTTSQPSISAFSEVFEEAIAEGKEIITIVISKELSGTYNSASAAAAEIAPDKITVIDSETTVANLKSLVKQAHEMAEKGKSRKEIVEAIEKQKKRMHVNLTVSTLEYLRRGGRLTMAQAAIGNILNVKPIIGLINGRLQPITKVRGSSKAYQYLVDKVPDDSVEISILHVLNSEVAEQLQMKLKEKFPHIPVTIEEIGPVIGSHLGPGAVGVCSKQ